MTDFEWDASRFGLGLPGVDNEHKAILKALREMQRVHSQWPGSSALATQAHALVTLIRTHFDRESALMRKLGYPQAARHEFLHAQLLERATDYLKRIEESNFVPREFFWFMNHMIESDMLTADKRIAEFLRPQKAEMPVAADEGDEGEEGEEGEWFQRQCARCKAQSPRVRSTHSLFGRQHGWRMHRRTDLDPVRVDWLCGACWARVRGV